MPDVPATDVLSLRLRRWKRPTIRWASAKNSGHASSLFRRAPLPNPAVPRLVSGPPVGQRDSTPQSLRNSSHRPVPPAPASNPSLRLIFALSAPVEAHAVGHGVGGDEYRTKALAAIAAGLPVEAMGPLKGGLW